MPWLWLLAAILLIIFLKFFSNLILQKMGDFLVIRDTPEKADCIVILSGERGERVTYGVELYKKKFAPIVFLSGGPGESGFPESHQMKRQALAEGIEEKDIIIEDKSLSTYENALYIKEIFDKSDMSSMILITSPYHSRRALAHFKKRFNGSGVKIYSCPPEKAWFNPEKWWKRRLETEWVVREYLCLLWHYQWIVMDFLNGKNKKSEA